MNTNAVQLLQVMRDRFACKEFDPARSISDEDFGMILEAGRLAPSSFGFEPWQFLVVQDRELRLKISEVSWGARRQMPGVSHYMVIMARRPSAMDPGGEYLQKTIMADTQHMPENMIGERAAKFRDFRANDFSLDGNERAGFEWACRQCYLALENMLLMAAALGADSCPIEGFRKEKLEVLLESRGLLDRASFGVACMAAFGYAATAPKRGKTRRPLEQVVSFA